MDIRFLEDVAESFPERRKILPSRQTILENLYSLLGTSYIWGGNWSLGIPEMKIFYPPKINFENLDPHLQKTWVLKGVDCSGLLYQVSNGITPRSTFLMDNFGYPVDIQNKRYSDIIKQLEPLDLIITYGHVVIVFDQHSVIESRGGKGVILTSIQEYFDTILKDKIPINDWDAAENNEKGFIIRRWFQLCYVSPN